MEELTQEKVERARRNHRLCAWMTVLCTLTAVAASILFSLAEINGMILAGNIASLVVFGGLTYNNRRIVRGKRPWGE